MFILFANGNGSASENNLDSEFHSQSSLGDGQRQRSYKALAGQPGVARALFALRADHELCLSFLASRSLNPEIDCSLAQN